MVLGRLLIQCKLKALHLGAKSLLVLGLLLLHFHLELLQQWRQPLLGSKALLVVAVLEFLHNLVELLDHHVLEHQKTGPTQHSFVNKVAEFLLSAVLQSVVIVEVDELVESFR